MKNHYAQSENGFTRPPNSRNFVGGSLLGITKKKPNLVGGFTLVEVMISIGLFTVIMVIGIGAILGVNATNKKTQAMRTIIDNMSFVMEDMARSMRLGDYFVCKDVGLIDSFDVYDLGSSSQRTQDGPDPLSFGPCKSISFEPYWDFLPATYGNQVVYYISNGAIFKKEPDSNVPFDDIVNHAITPVEVNIDEEMSGFTVVGSDRSDTKQPQITIVLVGTITLSGVQTDFHMQTTVSQRVLDVTSLSSASGSTGAPSTTGPTIPSDSDGGAVVIPVLPTP
jgi:type II secretory pathway pseudopilin PulG